MNKFKLACLSAVAIGISRNALAQTNTPIEDADQEIRYLVKLAPNNVAARTLSSRRDVLSTQAEYIVNNEGVILQKIYPTSGIISVVADAEELARLKSNGSVVDVVRADAEINISIPDVSTIQTQAQIPMAMNLENQGVGSWGIDRIDQRDNNYDGQYNPPFDGSGVIVYVMDSGVAMDHELLRDRVAYTKNTYNPDEEAFDCHGHGSHVIGTVGVENYGVATGATLVAVRPFNDRCGAGTQESFVGAIEFAVSDSQEKGKRAVVNMSLGYTAESADAPLDFFETAIQAGIDAGVVMVTSTGNDSYDTCGQAIGRMPEVISVAASRVEDIEYMFTNDGPCVDIHAPGVDIVSMDWFSGGVRSMTGTSMASPHVAGAAALVLQANPEFTPAQVRDYLIEQSTKDILRNFDSNGAPNRLLYVSDIASDGDIVIPPTCDEDPTQPQCIVTCDEDPTQPQCIVTCDEDPTQPQCIVTCDEDPTQPQCIPTCDEELEPCDDSVLANGEPVIFSGENKAEQVFTIDVPAGMAELAVNTAADNGDADLYILLDGTPTTSNYDCRGYTTGSNESCLIEQPSAGTYSIMVRAYDDFSDLALTATFSGEVTPPVDCTIDPSGPDCEQPCEIDNSCPPATGINETDLTSSDSIVRFIDVLEGQTLSVSSFGGAGDADLYVSFDSEAYSWWDADCSSRASGNNEECVINNTQAGRYYITLVAYQGSPFSGVTLQASAQ